jgi:hypothetical protein
MTLYARTPEGQVAAYSADSALPRKLKSLLKLVDGKTELETLVQGLLAFGDVRGVLQSLHAAGLLKVMSADGKIAAPAPRHLETSASPNDTSGPDTLAVSRHSTMMVSPDAANPARKQALARAVDLMSNFVLTHIPVDSTGVLKELESLESLEQLGATLGGYEQVIAQVGPATQEHLRQIRQILREYL